MSLASVGLGGEDLENEMAVFKCTRQHMRHRPTRGTPASGPLTWRRECTRQHTRHRPTRGTRLAVSPHIFTHCVTNTLLSLSVAMQRLLGPLLGRGCRSAPMLIRLDSCVPPWRLPRFSPHPTAMRDARILSGCPPAALVRTQPPPQLRFVWEESARAHQFYTVPR